MHCDRAAVGRVFDRVIDQIRDGALQQIGVAHDFRQRLVKDCLQRLIFRLGGGKHEIDDPPHDGRQIGWLARGQLRVAVQPREVQQIVHQIAKLPRVPRDGGEKTLGALWILERAVLKRLDKSGDHGERRAQLVRDVGDELLAQLFVTPRFGDIVRDDDEAGISVGAEARDGDFQISPVDRPGVDHLSPAGELHARNQLEHLRRLDGIPQKHSRGLRRQAQKLLGSAVAQQDALAMIDCYQALAHAGDDRHQLRFVGRCLRERVFHAARGRRDGIVNSIRICISGVRLIKRRRDGVNEIARLPAGIGPRDKHDCQCAHSCDRQRNPD